MSNSKKAIGASITQASLAAPAPQTMISESELAAFFRGKRVLITGHAGFKGAWLCLVLSLFGAKLYGYSLLPNSKPRLYSLVDVSSLLEDECIADIADAAALQRFVQHSQVEVVFHLAAQPLVRESYRDPINTYRTNVLGTLNLLEACRSCSSVRAVVNVTSDKCYENPEDGHAFRESDPMGGYDLYSSSKACAEILSASYRRSLLQQEDAFFLATARAGNVIGGGDFAKDRLLPDCIRALSQGLKDKQSVPDSKAQAGEGRGTIVLRQPQAVRPWQHVLEPLWGYMLLARHLYERDRAALGAFNFGPDAAQVQSVERVAQQVVALWGSGRIVSQFDDRLHEAQLLLLDSSKAQNLLGFTPVLKVQEAIGWTVKWYHLWAQLSGHIDDTGTSLGSSSIASLRQLSWQQIEAFATMRAALRAQRTEELKPLKK